MKFTAIKAAVAACLLAPVMSFAATTSTFQDSSAETVKIVGTGWLTVNASWTDLVAKYDKSGFQQYQATSLTWTLSQGDQTLQTGTLVDSATGPNKAPIYIDETALAAGKYTLTLNGEWDVNHGNLDVRKDVNVSLGSKSYSTVSPVPEPESYAMLLAGLGLMGTIAVRRKSSNA